MRNSALGLIVILICTLYVPMNAYAAAPGGSDGSINDQTGDVVVGTPIYKAIDITFFEAGGSGGFWSGWYHSNDLSNEYTNLGDVNGLSISDVDTPARGRYTARMSGSPTTAEPIYLLLYEGGRTTRL